jgi:hypothetical protein
MDIAIGGPWGVVAANTTTILRIYVEKMPPEQQADAAKRVADALDKMFGFFDHIKDRIRDND